MKEDEALKLWNRIFNILSEKNNIEIQTVRLDRRQGRWFLLEKTNDLLVVSNATNNTLSSELVGSRVIQKQEFIDTAQMYDDWKNRISSRTNAKSRNSSYILAIVSYLLDENNGAL